MTHADDETAAWEIRFGSYEPKDEKRRESLFSLGNGLILVRGCAPDSERSDSHYPGTYCAGCYNELTGEIEGETVRGRTLVNLPNWLPLTFHIRGEAEWFGLDRAEILSYSHRLDMKRGLTFHEVLVRGPAGRETFLAEERLVNMASPEIGLHLPDWCYLSVSGDGEFLQRYGAEMLIEIARLFASVSRFDEAAGRYRITGVVGPDEFHTSYPDTDKPEHRSRLTAELGFDPAETARWEDITRRMRVPFHGDGIISQFDGFGGLAELNLATLEGERPDWALEARGDDVNRYQVLKQADVLMLYHLLGERKLIAILRRLG